VATDTRTPDKRPRCPKCGEPARVAIVKMARVRCELEADGSVGRVLSTTRNKKVPLEYECGGGHTWDKHR
jgi:hypothetical protein